MSIPIVGTTHSISEAEADARREAGREAARQQAIQEAPTQLLKSIAFAPATTVAQLFFTPDISQFLKLGFGLPTERDSSLNCIGAGAVLAVGNGAILGGAAYLLGGKKWAKWVGIPAAIIGFGAGRYGKCQRQGSW